jgi:prefoldin subunit 5
VLKSRTSSVQADSLLRSETENNGVIIMASVDELKEEIEALSGAVDNLTKEMADLKFVISLLRTDPDGGIKFLNQEISSLRSSVETLAKAIRDKR